MTPEKCILIDVDGLRPDVFRSALADGAIPHIERLVGGGLHMDVTAPAPSITFCSQACLFTGAHPAGHGIPGNQYFDRFGFHNNGLPRHFAFDVGDTLAVDDAVLVFTHGLASRQLTASTIYERQASKGRTSVVAGNMYAKGATRWLKPGLANIARFTKGGDLFGMSSREYDHHIVEQLLDDISENGLADLTTLYFMGLDHDSHAYGPVPAQRNYLVEHVDEMVGQVWHAVSTLVKNPPLVVLFSDHGQIRVIPDDAHSLKIGFPFDREVAHLFSALGLDVHDYPGEDPDCDAVMALNGGLSYVYLRNKTGHWAEQPVFDRDVLPVAKAFWEAHESGRYATELRGALAGVLIRNVERKGWDAPFDALTPGGEVISIDEWFAGQPNSLYTDPVNRLVHHVNRVSGDLILISNYSDGYYFGGEITGVHGGLHPEDSLATLVYNWPGMAEGDWMPLSEIIRKAIEDRCASEGGRMPATCDVVVGIEAALGS